MKTLIALCVLLSIVLIGLTARTVDNSSMICWVENDDGSCLMTKRDWARMLLEESMTTFQGGTGEDYRP